MAKENNKAFEGLTFTLQMHDIENRKILPILAVVLQWADPLFATSPQTYCVASCCPFHNYGTACIVVGMVRRAVFA